MHMGIDQNKLLTIVNENIPQTKEYTYNVSGYLFSDYDKGIVVLHKKERKIINLKNLWDNMSITYIAPRKEMEISFDPEGCIKGLCLFDSFDETTGNTYYFLPKFAEKEIGKMNVVLERIGIPAKIEKSERWVIVQWEIKPKEHRGKYASLLFMLILLYGKMDIKNNELVAIKIQIPLFGQFLKYEEQFDNMKKQLAEEGIFINTSSQRNADGMIYQISSNDYELLHMIAKYYEPVEKFEKITKRDFTQEMKTKLIEFLETNTEIPSEGKEEVIKKLQEGTMKLLTK